MKPALLAQKLLTVMDVMRCPQCGKPLCLHMNSLVCSSGHCFDLSRRGYVNLAPSHDQAAEKYDSELFESRSRVFGDGFYAPVLNTIADMLQSRETPFLALDIGCGEGYYANELARRFPAARFVGLDLSRDAVTAAARGGSSVHWLVADLKKLPFADHSADVLLDVLTPADYAEFRRVLKAGGELIKVVPGAEYLRQVRAAVADRLRSGDSYDNARVLAHLRENADVVEERVIRETLPLTPEQSRAFLRMTPMTFSVPTEALDALSIGEITVHMHILRCCMR